MIIPYQRLSEDALQRLLEEYVLREGTEYGTKEFSLEEKVLHVRRQLEQGQAVLIYSQVHETVDIVPSDAIKQQPE